MTSTSDRQSSRARTSAFNRWALAVSLMGTAVTVTEAQIRTDGTLGGPAIALMGPNFLINEALGRLAGNNLFHSFQIFNVGTAESATFRTTTPALANVISRVTGGSASQINGLVRLDASNAAPNFFFINPAGVVFGKGAAIDVPAGFNVSTANYLKFPDGNFYADPNVVSTLSSAAPEAFGFLGTTRGTIAVGDGANLQTKSFGTHQPISVVAGDIVIDRGVVQTRGGDIRVIAVGSGVGQVNFTGDVPYAYGELAIVNGGYVYSAPGGPANAGDILISAGNVLIDGSGSNTFTGLASQTQRPATGDAGDLTINVAGTLVVRNAGIVSSETFSSGRAGAIKIIAGDMYVDNGTISSAAQPGSSNGAGNIDVTIDRTLGIGNGGAISSSTNSSGDAGTVQLNAQTLLMVAGGAIRSNTSGAGHAGIVAVGAGNILIDGPGTGIFSKAGSGSSNSAGNILVATPGLLSITNQGAIDSSTATAKGAGAVTVLAGAIAMTGGAAIQSNTSASGDAGRVTVIANDIVIDGNGSPDGITKIASVAQPGSSGDAGIVGVTAYGTVVLRRGGEILSDTNGAGQAGTVVVKAGNISIDSSGGTKRSGIFSTANASNGGGAGDIEVTTPGLLSITNQGAIDSSTFSGKSAGTVKLSAGRLQMGSGAQIQSNTSAAGRAGQVTVSANDIVIDGNGSPDGITKIASVAQPGSSGDAGSISVTATGTLSLLRGGEILSDTNGAGQAGTVVVKAGNISIDSSGGTKRSGIFSTANASNGGGAGDIEVTTPGLLSITNQGAIDSSTFSGKSAGTVKLSAGRLQMGSGAQIQSNTSAAGRAGQVTVSANDIVIDGNGSPDGITKIASVAQPGSSGDAGSISVTATGTLSLLRGGEILSDTNGAGQAGTVVVKAGNISIDSSGGTKRSGIFSTANASNGGGAGDIEVTTPGLLSITNQGAIDSSTFSGKSAGTVKLSAGRLQMGSGAQIQSNTSAAGRAGQVTVSANDIVIDGNGSPDGITKIASVAQPGSSGDAGSISVTATGTLSLLRGGEILSDTNGAGQAGTVVVKAGNISIDSSGGTKRSGIFSTANASNGGGAGDIEVTTPGLLSITNQGAIDSSTFSGKSAGTVKLSAGRLQMGSGAQIQSNTSAAGRAGQVTVSANDIVIDGNGSPDGITKIASVAQPGSSGDAGSISVTATGTLSLLRGGEILSDTNGAGQAGTVVVKAGNISIDSSGGTKRSGIFSTANASNGGGAGDIEVTTPGLLSITNQGAIDSSTFSGKSAGTVKLSAGRLQMGSGAQIQSNTSAAGRAGQVTVSANDIVIDGNGSPDGITKIASVAQPGSSGDAGSISVTATGTLSLLRGGEILSDTNGAGQAGTVVVKAGNISIDSSGGTKRSGIFSTANASNGGGAGDIEVTTPGLLSITNQGAIDSSTFSGKSAGTVKLSAGRLQMGSGAQIQSNTSAAGRAGQVTVSANDIVIDGNGSPDGITKIASVAQPGSSGDAGSISVTATGTLSLLRGGEILSDTNGAGQAGTVVVKAGNISIDSSGGTKRSGIFSTANASNGGGAGDIEVTTPGLLSITNQGAIDSSTFSGKSAGTVKLSAGRLQMGSGAQIQSNTSAAGRAGQVTVSANDIVIDGNGSPDGITKIASVAQPGSSGDAGSISVTATGTLSLLRGGEILSDTNGAGQAGTVVVKAGNISIDSSGGTKRSGIFSTANASNGGGAGDIEVTTPGLLSITNQGAIDSSTFSGKSAGTVKLSAGRLQMGSGAQIQSNTSAAGRAGQVTVSANDIVIDGNGSPDGITKIASVAQPGSSGDAGSISVTATGTLSLLRGGEILSDTNGAGQAGTVVVKAGNISIDSSGGTKRSGIFSTANASNGGGAGDIEVTTPGLLSITNQGAIDSSTFSGKDAGSVTVTAGRLDMRSRASIQSNTSAGGNAGVITVTADDIVVDSTGSGFDVNGKANPVTRISTVTSTGSSGNAGSVNVSVRADGKLALSAGGEILSDTNGSGQAGSVVVNAGSVTIDSIGGAQLSGIFSRANAGSTGGAGDIAVTAPGLLSITNRGAIDSSTSSARDAGKVTVSAGTLAIAGSAMIQSNTSAGGRAGEVVVAAGTLTADTNAFIGAKAVAGSSGQTGTVTVHAAGDIALNNGASLSISNEATVANPDGITPTLLSVIAQRITLANGGKISAGTIGNVAASNIAVSASEALSITSGAQVSSSTFAGGNAGKVSISAGDLHIDGLGSPVGVGTGLFSNSNSPAVVGGASGNAGSVDVIVSGAVSVANGGNISSNTSTSGLAGSVLVKAGTFIADSNAFIGAKANTGSSGQTGTVTVQATEEIKLSNGASLSIANDATVAHPESLTPTLLRVAAPKITLANGGKITAATSGNVSASNIEINVDPRAAAGNTRIEMTNGSSISSSTFSSGNAGTVKVIAGDLVIDNRDSTKLTGITSSTQGAGNAGTVDVTVSRELTLVHGGEILSDTFSGGNAGVVKVTAGALTIDRQNSAVATGIFSTANRSSSGNAGDVDVAVTGRLSLANGGNIDTGTSSSGHAGKVTVTAGDLSLESGGAISSNTFAKGSAGTVVVSAGQIDIAGQAASGAASKVASQAQTGSTGSAGSVTVSTTGKLSLARGGQISSSTFATGDAGTVSVVAGDIRIDGQAAGKLGTGIFSNANATDTNGKKTGNAGNIDVLVNGGVSIVNGGVISSSTSTTGHAGSVGVSAATISGDSNGFIGAAAYAGSSGQTGTVAIQAAEGITLANGAAFSIRNDATVTPPTTLTPTVISVTAPNITLSNGGEITAASSGNVAASKIAVTYGPQLTVSNARISTSAQDGNGGSIAVTGTGNLVLQNGQITTSVAGTQGDGGNIAIATPILVMQTGFIQANTAASNAHGGDVNIKIGTLLPSGGTLFVGGTTPQKFAPGVFGYNVIQAAAPTGLSGTIRISTPVLDITGSLSALSVRFLDTGGLGRSPCAIVGGSSLSQVGRGGLPPAAGDRLWINPAFGLPGISGGASEFSGAWLTLHPAASGDAGSWAHPCWT